MVWGIWLLVSGFLIGAGSLLLCLVPCDDHLGFLLPRLTVECLSLQWPSSHLGDIGWHLPSWSGG